MVPARGAELILCGESDIAYVHGGWRVLVPAARIGGKRRQTFTKRLRHSLGRPTRELFGARADEPVTGHTQVNQCACTLLSAEATAAISPGCRAREECFHLPFLMSVSPRTAIMQGTSSSTGMAQRWSRQHTCCVVLIRLSGVTHSTSKAMHLQHTWFKQGFG